MTRRRTSVRRSSGSVRICNRSPRNRYRFCARDAESSTIFSGTALVTHFGVANTNPLIALAAIRQTDRPLQDEWGLFDPRQAGLEALLRKIRTRAKDADLSEDTTPKVDK